MAETGQSATPGQGEPVGQAIRVFVSSTFADFPRERDPLQRRVFPHIAQVCPPRAIASCPLTSAGA